MGVQELGTFSVNSCHIITVTSYWARWCENQCEQKQCCSLLLLTNAYNELHRLHYINRYVTHTQLN